MKNKFTALMKRMAAVSAVVLPALAVSFSMSPCIFKMYEPKMPEKLLK